MRAILDSLRIFPSSFLFPFSPPGSDAFAFLPLLKTYYTVLTFNNLAVIGGITRQMCSDSMKAVTKAVLSRIILINRQKKLAKNTLLFSRFGV